MLVRGSFKSGDKVVTYQDDFFTISLHGEVFPATICHSKCELVVNGVKCNACKEYRDVLRAMHVRFRKKSSMEERTKISIKINHRYLDAPELTMHMSRLKTKLDESRRQIETTEEDDRSTHSE